MQIHYANKKLEKSTASAKNIKAAYGTRAQKVNDRLQELLAFPNLQGLRNLPQANCHELKGPYKGCLAVDISANFRIIFRPHHDPVPKKPDGGLDWAAVTEIMIMLIGEDYH